MDQSVDKYIQVSGEDADDNGFEKFTGKNKKSYNRGNSDCYSPNQVKPVRPKTFECSIQQCGDLFIYKKGAEALNLDKYDYARIILKNDTKIATVLFAIGDNYTSGVVRKEPMHNIYTYTASDKRSNNGYNNSVHFNAVLEDAGIDIPDNRVFIDSVFNNRTATVWLDLALTYESIINMFMMPRREEMKKHM